jgi:hypothetical protein
MRRSMAVSPHTPALSTASEFDRTVLLLHRIGLAGAPASTQSIWPKSQSAHFVDTALLLLFEQVPRDRECEDSDYR